MEQNYKKSQVYPLKYEELKTEGEQVLSSPENNQHINVSLELNRFQSVPSNRNSQEHSEIYLQKRNTIQSQNSPLPKKSFTRFN